MTPSSIGFGTPCALVDTGRLSNNIIRMQSRLDALGVRFRPHVKTHKCVPIAQAQVEAGANGITVSTLKEAERFFDAGFTDILYAVGIITSKLPQAIALQQRGCALKLVTDDAATARDIARQASARGVVLNVWIEIDTDGHRSGVRPDDPSLIDIGRALQAGGMHLGGVMTHAGSSYEFDTPEALRVIAEQERAGAVHAARRLRDAGLSCPVVSIGSTPTALMAEHLDGVTEVRAGVYALFDLVMCNVGVCTTDDVALSVMTSVIGHQRDRGWVIVDAGWMAMSRDRGTQRQRHDYGYGQVCDADGHVLDGWTMIGANQEHGIIAQSGLEDTSPGSLRDAESPVVVPSTHVDIAERFPVGTRLRILPNHACATGAQFPEYRALHADGTVETWPRFHGW